MSDLRTRIAETLWSIYAPVMGYADQRWDELSDGLRDEFCEDADAVIRELNLSVAVDYLSVDGTQRNFMLAGHYTEVTGDARRHAETSSKLVEERWGCGQSDCKACY